MKQMRLWRAVAGSAVLVAGCAHQEHVTRYETTQGGPAYAETSRPADENRTVVNAQTENTAVTPANTTSTTDTTVVTAPAPSTQTELSYTDVHPNIVYPVPPPANRASRTAVVTESTTTTTTPADTVVVEQVRQAMNNDPALVTIVPSIQVAAASGTVTLTGNVANQDQRQRIEYLTKGVAGVVTVNDQLQVAVAPTGRVSQQTLIYSNAPGVASTPPETGTVPRIYSSSADSTAITNQSAPSPPRDAAVAAALEASRSASSITNNQDLSVQEKSSSIPGASPPAITGTNTNSAVPDSSAAVSSSPLNSTNTPAVGPNEDLAPTSDRGSASRVYATNQSSNPSSQSGVPSDSSQKVDVRGTTDADKQIGAQMVQQLKNDASTVSLLPGLRISIENGKAVLRGSVKSEEEKSKIEAIAKQVPGVTGVENQLTVGANGTSQINESK